MRVVLADHDPAVLAAAARALQGLIDCAQVTSKQDCLARLREGGCDIVVACERLADGSGLDLIATMGMSHPDVLRIFAADAERLKKLGAHLTPFKLFDTIGYPLDSMQLRSAMALAIAERGDLLSGEYENVVLGADMPAIDEEPEQHPLESLPQIVLLTRDSAAAESANAALADKPYRVIAARDAGEARADLVARQPVLALIDVGTLGMDPVNWFVEAHRASPSTLLLALGRRNDGQVLEPLVGEGVVNRFVAKPVTQAGMRLVLDSALRMQTLNSGREPEAIEPRQAPPAPSRAVRAIDHEDALADPVRSLGGHTLSTVDWPAPGAGSASRSPASRSSRPDRHPGRVPLPLALAVAGLLAFGAAWFYFSRDGEPARTPATPAPADAPAQQVAVVAQPATPPPLSRATTPAPAPTPAVSSAPESVVRASTPVASGTLAVTPPEGPVAATTSIAPGVTLHVEATGAPATDTAPAQAPATGPAGPPPGAPATMPAPAGESPPTAQVPSRPVASPTDLRPSKLTAVSFAGKTLEEGPQPVVPAPLPRRAAPDRPPPVVMEMKLLRGMQPDYPDDARRKNIEGHVDLAFVVGSDGRVRDVAVTQSTPAGVFDDEAIAAVRRWRYDPRREDGVPVDHPGRVRLEFRLDK